MGKKSQCEGCERRKYVLFFTVIGCRIVSYLLVKDVKVWNAIKSRRDYLNLLDSLFTTIAYYIIG